MQWKFQPLLSEPEFSPLEWTRIYSPLQNQSLQVVTKAVTGQVVECIKQAENYPHNLYPNPFQKKKKKTYTQIKPCHGHRNFLVIDIFNMNQNSSSCNRR